MSRQDSSCETPKPSTPKPSKHQKTLSPEPQNHSPSSRALGASCLGTVEPSWHVLARHLGNLGRHLKLSPCQKDSCETHSMSCNSTGEELDIASLHSPIHVLSHLATRTATSNNSQLEYRTDHCSPNHGGAFVARFNGFPSSVKLRIMSCPQAERMF